MRRSPEGLGSAQLLSQLALLPAGIGNTKQKSTGGSRKGDPTGSLQDERGQEQKQGTTRFLHTAPPRGWADHLSRLSVSSANQPLPSPYLRNQPHPPRRASKGTCFLFLLPSCCSLSPNKDLPEFLIWPLISFY